MSPEQKRDTYLGRTWGDMVLSWISFTGDSILMSYKGMDFQYPWRIFRKLFKNTTPRTEGLYCFESRLNGHDGKWGWGLPRFNCEVHPMDMGGVWLEAQVAMEVAA